MDPKIHGSESVDQQIKARAYAMSLSTEVNMINCYKQCEHFFKGCRSIHFDVLIAYWMMAGYLGSADSIDKAYQKGHSVLRSLVEEGILKPSDNNGELVELATTTTTTTTTKISKPIQCKHEGLCVKEDPEFLDLLDLGKIENIALTDGMLKERKGAVNREYLSRQVLHSTRGHIYSKYLAHFNPRPNFLKLLLENVEQITVLLLRGYDELLPQPHGNFPLQKLNTLSVLEISGPSHLTAIPTTTISQLTQLQCLNLSNQKIEVLPHDFFSKLLELRWLILRGCSKLRYLPHIYHMEKLEVLDLSYTGVLMIRMPDLAKVPDIPPPHYKLTNSFLSSPSLPKLTNYPQPPPPPKLPGSSLRPPLSPDIPAPPQIVPIEPHSYNRLHNLILRECTSLRELPAIKMLMNLEVLDISGCEQLFRLPKDLCNLKELKVLNLFGCSGLKRLNEDLFGQMSSLLKLNLSGTEIKLLPSFANLTNLRTLSLRCLKLDSLETLSFLSNLIELNLSGIQISSSRVSTLDFLDSLEHLQILDLSQTSVEKLPNLSKLKSLTNLLLANCQNLKVLPDLRPLTNLEVLDLSLPDESTIKICKIETESKGQICPSLFTPSSLRKLVLTNRSAVQKLYPPISSDLCGSNEIELIKAPLGRMGDVQQVTAWNGNVQGQGQIARPAEIHIISCVRNRLSRFDQYIHEFITLHKHILRIQEKFTPAMVITTTAKSDNHHFEKQLKMLDTDLSYIQENIEMLQSSRICENSEELLQELMEGIARLSSTDSSADLANLKHLLKVVVKLKLLVPPREASDRASSEITRKKKQEKTTGTKNMENITADIDKAFSSLEFHNQEKANLLSSNYQSLTDIQKYCLLSFSTFPCNELDKDTGASLVIKKKILIFLWVGEGIIDPYREENAAFADTENQVSRNISTAQQANRPNTIEAAGEQILEVLRAKGFTEPVIKKHRYIGSYRMSHLAHSFVIAMAKKEGLFYFNMQNNRLTPYFTRSKRDCSLQCQAHILASSNLQANHTNSRKEVESLSDVLTLFNNNESTVYISREWFSKMKHLSVLYLGIWHSKDAKHIEIVDEKFLKDLKKMKQLRFLSLQGLSAIKKLPNSICKLANLKILDLRECSYLEELPANIGSLKNLTHLDITNCRFLTKMPKGISLLSKLEVLKGFVITNQDHDPCDRKVCFLDHWWDETKNSVIHGLFRCKNDAVCTFRDLLKIEKLTELSIVIMNIHRFFDDEYLDVFKEMRGLRKLKIIWERSIDGGQAYREWDSSSETEQTTEPFRWQKLKCWENQPASLSDTKETTRSNYPLQNVEKLELWCLPHGITPFWLNPKNMQNLKRLYIIGGNLNTMPYFEDKWNVTTLRLRYLEDFDILWSDLRKIFPYLTYLEYYKCKPPRGLPRNEDGVWRAESEVDAERLAARIEED